MHRFVQIHALTHYPPSNPNRDDLGRPKTAMMGGAQRLRISSQSLKRAWRTSEVFQEAVGDAKGIRTKEMGRIIYKMLMDAGAREKEAIGWTRSIAEVFGKLKKENKEKPMEGLEIEQLTHFSPEEQRAIRELCAKLGKENRTTNKEELELLRHDNSAVDIALFGRMLASKPGFNVEAAAQVAHAVSVHQVTVEDDFFTAVDDLNEGVEDVGAGHMGETEFGAALHYLYLCVDAQLLTKNLDEDGTLAAKGLRALVQAMASIAPSGKQNSFGNRVRASYILAERGPEQPRNLSVAFLEPVKGSNLLEIAETLLADTRENMGKVYGDKPESRVMNARTGEGSLENILNFITEG